MRRVITTLVLREPCATREGHACLAAYRDPNREPTPKPHQRGTVTPRPKDEGVHTLIQRLPCPPADAARKNLPFEGGQMAVQERDAGGDFGKEAKNALNQKRKNREKPLQVEGVTGHRIA